MLNKLVNYFLPSNLSEKDNLKTERIFVIVLLISAVSNLSGIQLSITIEIPVIGYLLFANAAINILLLFLYKRGFPREIAAHIVLGQQALSFAMQAISQGGLMSPAVSAFFLLPALAMLIVGKKGAIWWLGISLLLTTSFFLYESLFERLSISYNLEKQNLFFFSSLMGINITIFLILLVYENSKNKALETIQKKHNDLKATQSQLIQSEKMASLGELTAGIAHEIQNPLNFVNNFSEVSNELIDEMNEELDNGDINEAKTISHDIKQNLEKINRHGKRAEAIVKGMLQHSRTSSGVKTPTDINALVDEYLRLSYHGLRAKDKSFQSEFKVNLENSLPLIKTVSQDIGRVLLNLINNAFYAVNEKAKELTPQPPKSGEESRQSKYKPEVFVSTISYKSPKGDLGIKISVKDNGKGIPDKVKDKIFQPFFTTKPTGSGTGLGLSLSYDIIKVHGGELKVESKENMGTEFIITIPIQS